MSGKGANIMSVFVSPFKQGLFSSVFLAEGLPSQIISYIKQGLILNLDSDFDFTSPYITNIAGEQNNVTLYTGRYVQLDGAGDSIDFSNITLSDVPTKIVGYGRSPTDTSIPFELNGVPFSGDIVDNNTWQISETTLPTIFGENKMWFDGVGVNIFLGTGDAFSLTGAGKVEWRGSVYIADSNRVQFIIHQNNNDNLSAILIFINSGNLIVGGRSTSGQSESFQSGSIPIATGAYEIKCFVDYANDEIGISINNAPYTITSVSFISPIYNGGGGGAYFSRDVAGPDTNYFEGVIGQSELLLDDVQTESWPATGTTDIDWASTGNANGTVNGNPITVGQFFTNLDTYSIGSDGTNNFSGGLSFIELRSADDTILHQAQLNEYYDEVGNSLNGLTAFDTVNNNHGTYVGCSGFSGEGIDPNFIGEVFRQNEDKILFDGIDVCITTNDNTNLNSGGDQTFLLEWVAPNSFAVGTETLLAQNDGTGVGRGIFFKHVDGTFRSFLGGVTSDTGVIVETGRTYNIELTVNGGNLIISVDGIERVNTTVPQENATGDIIIGANKSNLNKAGGFFKNMTLPNGDTWDGTIEDANAKGWVVQGNPISIGQIRSTIPQTAAMNWNRLGIHNSANHELGDDIFYGATTVGEWAVFSPFKSNFVLGYNPKTKLFQLSASHGLGSSACYGATTVGEWAVFAPFNADRVLAYNPITDTLQTSDLHGLGNNAFYEGTTVGDWAVFSPWDSNRVLAYNPITDTLQTSDLHGFASNAFWGATTVGDWAVFAPYDGNRVLAYNPITDTLQTSAPHGLGSDAFLEATAVGDWAVFAPRDSTSVLAYNPITDTLQTSAPHGLGNNIAFLGATTVGDWAVFAPRNADNVLAYNPITDTLQTSAPHGLGDNIFYGATTVGDWAVFAPWNANMIMAYNPTTDKLFFSESLTAGNEAFYDVTAVGEWLVFSPHNADNVLSFSFTDAFETTSDFVPSSLTDQTKDINGFPIVNPRPNTQVANLFGEGENLKFPADFGDLRSLTLAIFNDGSTKDIIPNNGQGTLLAIANDTVAGGSIFTINGVETSTLQAGWNIITLNYGQDRDFSGAEIIGTSGSFLGYEASKSLTLQEAQTNFEGLRNIYSL